MKRKSIEPIALAAGVAVRTLQEFLADFAWDHRRVDRMLRQLVMDRHGCEAAIGVINASAHAKQGDKTPGVKRQCVASRGPKVRVDLRSQASFPILDGRNVKTNNARVSVASRGAIHVADRTTKVVARFR